jgi:tetratricopeptide (TPR) repeat protein
MKKILKQIADTPPLIYGSTLFVFFITVILSEMMKGDTAVITTFLFVFLSALYYQIFITLKRNKVFDEFEDFLISMDSSIRDVFTQYFNDNRGDDSLLQMGDIYYRLAFSESHLDKILNGFNKLGLSKYSIFIMLLERSLYFYSKVTEDIPDSYRANLQLGNIYYHLNHHRDARKYYTTAIETDSTDPEIFYYRGLCNKQLNDLRSAHDDFSVAISLNPKYKEAYYTRGLISYILHDYTSAIHDFNSFLIESPEDSEILYFKGVSESHSKKYDSAIESFSKALAINPGYGDALKDRALTYYHLKKYDEGLRDINTAITKDPANFHNFFVRGMIYFAQKKYLDAIAEYSKAVDIDPKVPETYFELAKVASEMNQKEEAIIQLDKALERNPYYIEALELRGNLKIESGDLNGGKKDLDKVSDYRVNYYYDIASN